jgi:hypothetical protein
MGKRRNILATGVTKASPRPNITEGRMSATAGKASRTTISPSPRLRMYDEEDPVSEPMPETWINCLMRASRASRATRAAPVTWTEWKVSWPLSTQRASGGCRYKPTSACRRATRPHPGDHRHKYKYHGRSSCHRETRRHTDRHWHKYKYHGRSSCHRETRRHTDRHWHK